MHNHYLSLLFPPITCQPFTHHQLNLEINPSFFSFFLELGVLSVQKLKPKELKFQSFIFESHRS